MKLYKYYKNDCAPCYALSRILMNINLPKNIEIVPMNVGIEENKTKAKELGISAVPVLMFEDGRKLEGKKTKEEIINFINGGIL